MLTCRCVQTIAEGMFSIAVDQFDPKFRGKLKRFYVKAKKKGWWAYNYEKFVPSAIFVSSVSRTVSLVSKHRCSGQRFQMSSFKSAIPNKKKHSNPPFTKMVISNTNVIIIITYELRHQERKLSKM